MSLFVYAQRNTEVGRRLFQRIKGIVSKDRLRCYQKIDALEQKLRQPMNNQSIALLLAVSREELTNLLSARDLLLDIGLILILPDREKGTIAIGHTLYPRYLSYADSNFKDVAAVLMKMIELMDSKKQLSIRRYKT